MLESRLIEHLKVLNSNDYSDFLRYAKAITEYEKDMPEDTFLLLKYIIKNIDTKEKLRKEFVFKNLYAKEEFKSTKIENFY